MTDSPVTILKKIGLAVFKDRKIMMVRDYKHDVQFSFLGGKIEPGEDDLTCAQREAEEEIRCKIAPESFKYLETFEGDITGRLNTRVNIRLYEAKLIGEPQITGDVVEIKYFDSTIPEECLSPTSTLAFQWLKENNYID